MMNNMTQLISWFQLEYPQLVVDMKDSNHHLTYMDKMVLKEHNDIYLNGKFQGIPSYSQQAYNLNPYHLESDIFTHTMMVCKQAEKASYEVKLAALLHDIGKPSTRKVNPKNGRVSFFNHDAVSAFMSLEILKREELGLTKKQQVHIFNLIALHTQVYKLTNEQLKEIGDINLVTDLIELGKADHAGRFHTAGNAVIPDIDGIFGETLSGVSSLKRGGHYSTKEKEVIILIGLPASGKSSWINGIKSSQLATFIVSRDDILVMNTSGRNYSEKWQNADQNSIDKSLQTRFKEATTVSQVYIDMTHMSKKSRRKSLSHFDSSYKKKAVVFLTDLQRNRLQNLNRHGKLIPEDVIQKMMRSFYPPTLEEFDEIEYVL